MSGQWHPDAEALARYQAGRVRGFRDRRLAAHVASCARCASVTDQLATVSTVLASVPAPPMPDAVERQITAALAAEAAARQAGPAACLLLVGFGYLLSQTSSSSSSSSVASGAAASASGSVNNPEAAGPVSGSAGKAKSPADLVPREGLLPTRFLVVESGTKYEQATLVIQVGTALARNATSGGTSVGSGAVPSQAAPSSSASSAAAAGGAGGSPPSRALIGCVSHFMGNATPRLVDQATYQGQAVYVIADAHRVWVVGRGCTAGNPELITTASLPASG